MDTRLLLYYVWMFATCLNDFFYDPLLFCFLGGYLDYFCFRNGHTHLTEASLCAMLSENTVSMATDMIAGFL